MEEVILDQPVIQQQKSNTKYGSFWERVGAITLDWIILVPVSFGISYVNTTSWKSSLILILISIVGTGYKPFMEFRYGATLGKMAVKLRVTNTEFEEASLAAILLRNIFHIVPAFITLLFTLAMYNDPGFESVSGLMEFGTLSQQYATLQYINYAVGFLGFIDAIVMAADQRKRSLHDRIGGTVVINAS
jgi:uncharacterized RDD family membrane protein YckC